MSRVVGIDLGTTNSCVAVIDRGEPVVIANSEGSRTTPSIVAFSESGDKLVGQIAKRQAKSNPEHTVAAIKRLVGRRFDDDEVRRFARMAPFGLEAAENGDAWIRVQDKLRSPEEIAALILVRMRETAQDYLGEEVTDAVITVPAYFNDAQRQATKDAGRIAGLNVLRIINEPTAAALAYGLDHGDAETIVVFDLGGGTFDVSILQIGGGVFEVKATRGDPYLGGEDFDELIVNRLAEAFQGEFGIDPRQDPMALQRLKEAAERGKQELSSANETDINLPFLSANDDGPQHLMQVLTREALEELTAPLLERLDAPCQAALQDAGISRGQIDQVLLVGGMTRMPRVMAQVEEIFGCAPSREVNPDEVVAVGAAVQGSVLGGDTDDVLLLDVTPLSIGVETQGGVMTRIIPRNTTIPTRRSQVFSTTEDNQDLVRVHIVQGEREMAADNESLGCFDLIGIPAAPRGVPQIEVRFDVDADGVLDVSARDQGTGREQQIQVTASGGLTPDQVDRLLADAAENRAGDSEHREQVEQRNLAEGLVYSVGQTLAEFASGLEPETREEITVALEQTRKVLAGDDPGLLGEAIEQLQQQAYRISEVLYPGFAAPEGPENPEDDELLIGFPDEVEEDLVDDLDPEDPGSGD